MRNEIELIAGLSEGVFLLSWTVARFAWQCLAGPPPAEHQRKALRRVLRRLEQQGLVERSAATHRYRAVQDGAPDSAEPASPAAAWNRAWDGIWRCLAFDLPTTEHALRVRLHRLMHRHRLGYLQQSLWISPDPLTSVVSVLAAEHLSLERMMVFELHPPGGVSGVDIATASWDFNAINEAHDAYRGHLKRAPFLAAGPFTAAVCLAWARRERQLWRRSLQLDPLLPRPLLPPEYRGTAAWEERRTVFGQALRRLRSA